jgi:GMP synthase-like glutamine amidotransferase
VTTCLVVQHEEPERPYAIGDALKRAKVEVDVCRVFSGQALPLSLDSHDGLVVMGGPMSATTDEGFPTRREETDLVREALGRNIPMLGVCLGAQLLALAAGGAVFPGDNGPEIGWGTVELTEAAHRDELFAGLSRELDVLHWHRDTFALPGGAVRLASSGSYENQAFRSGSSAWGLQFHVEVDAPAVSEYVGSFGKEALAAGTTSEVIEAESPAALQRLEPHRRLIVDRFARLVARGSD